MKELSIEQKAQRYDEAIERAKNTIEVNQTIPNIVECVESLFPELKESEDEKIRKAIIDGLKEMKSSFHTISSIKIDDAIAWLKKQGEQKSFDYENANIKQKDFAPKAKPKFKVGDWVVYNYPHTMYPICLITAINENYVELKGLNGGQFQTEIYDLSTNYHLWTIQNAKDGDVLVSKVNKPFIYNGNSDLMFIGAHCGIATDDLFVISSKGGCSWTINEHIYPATKEQRDALMKAITDAGYVFDFEKKELKKIKQSSTINQFTIEQASMLDKHVDKFLEQKTAEPNWVHHKVDLSDCSEEYCKAYYDGWNNCNQQHAQLKAEQKTAEWSKEDEDTIKFLINHFCVSHYNRSFQFTSDKVITCDKLIEKIRNLRPHWRPSDEQMATFWDAICNLNNDGYKWINDMKSLFQDLKKLREE